MKIAILSEGYYPEISGVTTSLATRAEILAQLGHEIRIYAPDYAPLAEIYPDYKTYIGNIHPQITVVPFPSKPYTVDYTRDPQPFSFGKIARDIEGFEPDIIHVECPARLFLGFLSRPGVKLAQKLGVPKTAIYHTNYLAYIEDYKEQAKILGLPGVEKFLKKLVVWVYNSYDLTMVPTKETHDYLIAQGLKQTRLGDFYGVDTEKFKPHTNSFPAAYEAIKDSPRILYVGRLTPDKNIDDLLAAFAQVRENYPHAKFIFLGGGPEDATIRAWAEGHDDTLLLGRIPPHKIAPYFVHADIFVTASAKENRPLTVLEAMSSGLPVVAPAAGGIKDEIENGRTGLLIPPHDSQALANAVDKLVADQELRQRIGAAARAAILPLSWENSAKEMLAIWEHLLGNLSPAR